MPKFVVVRSNPKSLEDAQRDRDLHRDEGLSVEERIRRAHGNPLLQALLIATLQLELDATRDPEEAEAIRDLLRAFDREVMS